MKGTGPTPGERCRGRRGRVRKPWDLGELHDKSMGKDKDGRSFAHKDCKSTICYLDKHCVWHYLQTDGGLVMRKIWNPTISTFFTKMLINTSIYMNYSIDL